MENKKTASISFNLEDIPMILETMEQLQIENEKLKELNIAHNKGFKKLVEKKMIYKNRYLKYKHKYRALKLKGSE